jgi:hypothetical protein
LDGETKIIIIDRSVVVHFQFPSFFLSSFQQLNNELLSFQRNCCTKLEKNEHFKDVVASKRNIDWAYFWKTNAKGRGTPKMPKDIFTEQSTIVGRSKDDPEGSGDDADTYGIEEGAKATDGSVLPWYSDQIFEKSKSDFDYLKNSGGEKKIKSAISKHFSRLGKLPKRDKMKYLVEDVTETSEMPTFSNFGHWHARSVAVDRGSRLMLESVAAQVEQEVRQREKRFEGLHQKIADQKYSIHDAKRQNKILNKKAEKLEEQLAEAEKKCNLAKKTAVEFKKRGEEERKKTRKVVYSSCVAELNLKRDRANMLARPIGESVWIECCCSCNCSICGKPCKNPDSCLYKCYFRDEVYVEDKRFRTETVYGCWKCKTRVPFDKPWYLNYRNEAYEIFQARTGFSKFS